jgi:hypothetical protein
MLWNEIDLKQSTIRRQGGGTGRWWECVMSQWWVLFVLGFGVGLACQIVFPVWPQDAKWLAAPVWPIRQAKSIISDVLKRGASLFLSAILWAAVVIILVSGSH